MSSEKMIFILKGKRYQINSLNPELDEAFIELHNAYIGDGFANWSYFENEVIRFLNDHAQDVRVTENYFNNFGHISNHFLSQGKYDEVELIWQQSLSPVFKWEDQNAGKRIHKGTPYYFWGATAVLKGDLDKGYALMHQALTEDSLTQETTHPRTPAYFFATADHTEIGQAFRQWPLEQAKFLDSRLGSYRFGNNRTLTLEGLRARFFSSPPSIDVIYLFAYTIARLLRMEEMPTYVLESNFAAQMQINVLFDVTLVIDAALKTVNPNKWKFIDHACYLAQRARLGITKAKLLDLNRAFYADFNGTLINLFQGRFSFPDGSKPIGLGVDLAITYGLRNRAAHDIRTIPAMWEMFPSIERMLFNILFLTVESLY